MEFRILGPMELRPEDGTPVEIGGGRERTILGVLVARAGEVVAAERLIDEVWGEDLPANPANALQVRVSRLRKVVGDALVTRPPGYLLDVEAHRVDAREFEVLVERARREEPVEARRILADALALFRGDPFADISPDGTVGAEAARLAGLRLDATESLLAARLDAGEVREVIPELEALVDAHPLRESIRGVLMLALYRAGRQADALRVYGDGRRRLAEELGIEPDAELQQLEERILMQDPSLNGRREPAKAAAEPVVRVPRRDLPARLTSFVGRDAEVAELVQLLGRHRLVTVTGPGGAGKTSLALPAAHRVPTDLDTSLVELAAVSDPQSVAEQMASSLGLESGPSGDPTDQLLLSYFRDRRAVLVVDNGEHVLDGVAALLEGLLARSPGLTVVATSRERLGIQGERLFALAGLGPEDSARLFGERAGDLGVAVAADDPAVVDICRTLDGMPLAIELAAARTTTLPPPDIAARLDRRFELLTGGARTALPRHQTLRAAIAWSHDLLEPGQAAMFRRLSVLRSSWDIRWAAAVCGVDEATAIEQVGALVDRSMVERVGAGRFRQLDTLRAYAQERLDDAGERDATLDRFLANAERLAAEADREIRSDRQSVWVRRLAPDGDHLRNAVEAALAAGAADRALHLCGLLGYYWFCQALVQDELRLVERALGFAGTDPLARARAIQSLLMLNFIQAVGRSQDLLDLADEMLATELAGGGPPHTRWAAAVRAIAHAMGGDPKVGAAALEEAVLTAVEAGDVWTEGLVRTFAAAGQAFGPTAAMSAETLEPAVQCTRRAGDPWMLAFTLSLQATVHRQLGDYPAAVARLEEALALAEQVGSRWMEANMHSELGNLAVLMGDHQTARARHLAAEPIAESVGAPGLIGHVANSRGMAARARGEFEESLVHHGRALRVYRNAGGQGGEALALDGTGYALQELGRFDEAGECHRQAYELGLAGGDLLAMALSTEGLAGVAMALGDHTDAGLLLGAAERLRASVGAPLASGERASVDRSQQHLQAAIGAGAFDELLARGRLLGDDELTALVRRG